METITREAHVSSQRGSPTTRENVVTTLTIDFPFFHTGLGRLLLTAVIARLLGVSVAEVGALVLRSFNPHTLSLLSSAVDVIRNTVYHW